MWNREKAASPRPDFYRKDWQCLNGSWEFDFDDEGRGLQDKWYKGHKYGKNIQVPFCYQSEMSGIHDTGKHQKMWYHRKTSVPEQMIGKRVWLNFGAVDYEAFIWVNGEPAGSHSGGHTSFSMEITHLLDGRELDICVYVVDSYDIMQPRGKQHWLEQTDRCWYTATSGIWQDVWLEAAAGTRIERALLTPDIDTRRVKVELTLSEEISAGNIFWEASYEKETVSAGQVRISGKRWSFYIEVAYPDVINNLIQLWSPENPVLYDLRLELQVEAVTADQVETYFGMRKIERAGDKILLNNVPLYQKLVLDQGYWPESLLTPPSREYLEQDIRMVKAMGFNGVRKHQKIETPAFLYYADCMGLLVWEEMASNYEYGRDGLLDLQKEYGEMILRDYNHPSIITWVPFNESWGIRDILFDKQQQAAALALYQMTRAMDNTRLVSPNDGWEMVGGDLATIHDYESDGVLFYEKYKDREAAFKGQTADKMFYADGFSYQGEPVILSEFGGIAFEDGNQDNWGYNEKASNPEEFLDRLKKLMKAIEKLDYMQGYCYTQLTDVEQETNGLLYPDRTPKVPLEKIREIVE